jgi:hypothetical protein
VFQPSGNLHDVIDATAPGQDGNEFLPGDVLDQDVEDIFNSDVGQLSDGESISDASSILSSIPSLDEGIGEVLDQGVEDISNPDVGQLFDVESASDASSSLGGVPDLDEGIGEVLDQGVENISIPDMGQLSERESASDSDSHSSLSDVPDSSKDNASSSFPASHNPYWHFLMFLCYF